MMTYCQVAESYDPDVIGAFAEGMAILDRGLRAEAALHLISPGSPHRLERVCLRCGATETREPGIPWKLMNATDVWGSWRASPLCCDGFAERRFR